MRLRHISIPSDPRPSLPKHPDQLSLAEADDISPVLTALARKLCTLDASLAALILLSPLTAPVFIIRVKVPRLIVLNACVMVLSGTSIEAHSDPVCAHVRPASRAFKDP